MNESNVDYKKMYHKMVNAAEDAMKILITAQLECEDMYLDATELSEEEVELHARFKKIMEEHGITIIDRSVFDNLEDVSG